MKVLVFDTETTGLPTERNPAIIATHKWPYIVQLSYIIYDTEQNVIVDYVDRLIKLPQGVSISAGSQEIHHITSKMCRDKGQDLKQELIEFNDQLLNVDMIIAHNISFDKNMIMVECIRNKVINNFTKNGHRKTEYCTMRNSVNICKIERENRDGEKYFKFPKLLELHEHFFKTVPKGLHNSMVDVLVCLRCYIKMKFDIDLEQCSPSYNMLNNIYLS